MYGIENGGDMDPAQKKANQEVGKRLREARKNLARFQAEFAEALNVSEEHYRRYESGATGLSVDKLYILFHEFGINPTYLVTGEHPDDKLELEYYLENCDEDENNIFWDRMVDYIQHILKT